VADPRGKVARHGWLRKVFLHEGVHAPAEGELVAARQAFVEVGFLIVQYLARERPVEVGEELLHRLRTTEPAHSRSSFTKPWRRAQSQSVRSRIFRARCRRDITVPIGQPSTSASSR